MAGPAPNPNRIRTNATPGFTQLPWDGYKGPIPNFPLDEASVQELGIWNDLWRTPQAVMWARMGKGLYRVIARYVRNLTILESDRHASVAVAHLNGECRQIEQCLGLSPKAMQTLRWEVPGDEVEEARSTKRTTTRSRVAAIDEEAV